MRKRASRRLLPLPEEVESPLPIAEKKGLLVANRDVSEKAKAASRRLLPLPEKVESRLAVVKKVLLVGKRFWKF